MDMNSCSCPPCGGVIVTDEHLQGDRYYTTVQGCIARPERGVPILVNTELNNGAHNIGISQQLASQSRGG